MIFYHIMFLVVHIRKGWWMYKTVFRLQDKTLSKLISTNTDIAYTLYILKFDVT